MGKLTEFLAMGGYGAYVWPSFLITAAVMLAMTMASVRSLRRAQRILADLQDHSVTTRNEA